MFHCQQQLTDLSFKYLFWWNSLMCVYLFWRIVFIFMFCLLGSGQGFVQAFELRCEELLLQAQRPCWWVQQQVSWVHVLLLLMFSISLTALLPEQIISFFEPIFNSAKELDRAYKKFSSQIKAPFITVRSCGLLCSDLVIPHSVFPPPLLMSCVFVFFRCSSMR